VDRTIHLTRLVVIGFSVVLKETFLILVILSEGLVEGNRLRVRKLATVGGVTRKETVLGFTFKLGVECVDEFPLTMDKFSTLSLIPDPDVVFRNRKSSYTCTF
jgi:hypothetical protein